MRKIPLLWRFHLVHHSDRDLDITTVLHVYSGEIIGSVFFRSAAIILIGVTPLTVLVYEIVFEAATQFNHGNLKIKFGLKKYTKFLNVTPRMHGINHSEIKNETDSNNSNIFLWWAKIHKTIQLLIPQSEIIICVRSYQYEKELYAL